MKKIFLLITTIFCFSNLTHAQPGQLDLSFGNHGIVTADLGKDYAYPASDASQLLLQSDGSIFVIERAKGYLSKRHADGSRDVSYGVNGYSASADFEEGEGISAAVMQADGKIVAVGAVLKDKTQNHGYAFGIARYNVDGSLDSSFSFDGKQITSFGRETADYPNSVTLQKDGKILVAGSSQDYLSFTRYNTDGSLDSTFASDGVKKSDIYYYPGKMILQNDGKILINVHISYTNKKILRFNTDASPDTTFAIDVSDYYWIYSIAVQSDGKILSTGMLNYGDPKSLFFRYNADGSPDTTFSGDGKEQIKYVAAIAVKKNGKIILANAYGVYQYNIDGSADSTFGKNGKQVTGDELSPATAVIQPDGRILVGGGIYNSYLALARFNSNGSSDKTFDKDGKLIDFFNAKNTFFKRIVIQKDGKLLAAGRTWNGSNFDFIIARYSTDGSPDSTFGKQGILITGVTFTFKSEYNNANVAITVQNDGKIVAAGDYTLARFNADGSTDSTFSQDGKLITDSATYYNSPVITSLAVQKDGKILVAANGGSISRYNTNGSPDRTFGSNGKQTLEGPDGNSFYDPSIATQSDGKIVVAGSSPDIKVIRLYKDGSFDLDFGNNGTTNTGSDLGGASRVILQNDGKILIGSSTDYSGHSYVGVFRVNTDGSLDTAFNHAGGYIKDNNPSDGSTRTSIALQDNGKIIVSASALFRFNANGSLDTTFNNNALEKTGFDINDLSISNNKLYSIGGDHIYTTPFNGNLYGKIAGYTLDGRNIFPTISLTAPANNATYLAYANIKLTAVASDSNGTVEKVAFYRGNTLLDVETAAPYSFVWKNVPLGNYTLTARATDNDGLVTVSVPVHVSVVRNQPPAVSIISPANNQTYADSATIHLAATAADTDGRITKVEFYNGTELLRTEYKYPYTYHWKNVPAGTYVFTAKATDNFGAQTISALVKITVSGTAIVSSRPYQKIEKTALSIRLNPNPAGNIVNIYTNGLVRNKPATLSIISLLGTVRKTIKISNSTTQLDVSFLVSGVYTLKIVSGDKIVYRKFIKL